mgnify:CR=1 FL=1
MEKFFSWNRSTYERYESVEFDGKSKYCEEREKVKTQMAIKLILITTQTNTALYMDRSCRLAFEPDIRFLVKYDPVCPTWENCESLIFDGFQAKIANRKQDRSLTPSLKSICEDGSERIELSLSVMNKEITRPLCRSSSRNRTVIIRNNALRLGSLNFIFKLSGCSVGQRRSRNVNLIHSFGIEPWIMIIDAVSSKKLKWMSA